MAVLKTSMVLIVISAVSMAQINISGVVKDSATGVGLAGAVVRLSKYNYADTTDTNGSFLLHSVVGITVTPAIGSGIVPLKVGAGNRLEFVSAQTQRVYASAVNLRGRTVTTVYDDIVAPGKYCVPAPVLPAGYYFYVAEMAGSRYSVPFVVTGGEPARARKSGATSVLPEKGKSVLGTVTRKSSAGAIEDTIVVAVRGYYQRLVAVTDEVISGLEIKCRKYADSVTDIEGNVYYAVTVGTQVWMVENLKTTKYNDSIAIPLVTDNTAWTALTTPGYCWYNNNATANKDMYGALYNWHAIGTGKLAPAGWHVATDTEWTTLTTYLGGESTAGAKLKEAGLGHWKTPNTGATNETGFSALPGGFRLFNGGAFSNEGGNGDWWSCTGNDAANSWSRNMNFNNAFINRNSNNKKNGYSVRCVRD